MITNLWINSVSEDALYVRKKVFVEEQNVPIDIEQDAYDTQSINLILYVDEKPVATGRIYHDAKTFRLGRICVLKEFRGQYLGDLLVRLLLVKVFSFSPSVVKIDAQMPTVAFYEKYGFKVISQPFETQSGITHVTMSITKDEITLKSKCGKEINISDFYD